MATFCGLVFVGLTLYIGFYLMIWGISLIGMKLDQNSKFGFVRKIATWSSEKIESVRRKKKRLIYLSIALPIFIVVGTIFTDAKDVTPSETSVKTDLPTSTSVVESSVELNVKELYKPKSNKFKFEGKATEGAKIELIEGLSDKPSMSTVAKNGKFSFVIDTSDRIYYIVKASKTGMKTVEKNVAFERSFTQEEKIAQFKKQTKTPNYNQLKKNPDNFTGTQAIYKGKVLQALEKDGVTDLRISVKNMGYGIWSSTDVIYVTYAGKTSAVEDSVITVYGTIMGNHTYKSQAGWDISVPMMMAEMIK